MEVTPDAPEVAAATPWLRRFPLRSQTLPPATHTNAYLLGEDELLLIDPGSSEASENDRLLAELAELRRPDAEARAGAGHRVTAIFLTHHHIDHVSGTAYLQERLHVPLYAHPRTAELLSAQGLKVDRLVEDGERLAYGRAGCTALYTPGHAVGHLCLLDGAGAGLIAGDMVASVGTILINPGDGGDMALYLQSLERLLRLAQATPSLDSPSLRLWPAHGPSVGQGEGLLRFYLRHRQEREERVVAALQKGAATLKNLWPVVYADKPDVHPGLAGASLMAHLKKLEREGRARVNGETWSLL